jgi:hypothetical protein
MSKQKENKNVVFRRIGGKVVPITIGAAGAGIAADAARTRVVYKTKKMTIVRKRGTFMPIGSYSEKRPMFGTGLYAYSNRGKYMGRTIFDVTKEGKASSGNFDWLTVKKRYRGQGLSKKLAKQGAIEMKGMGAKSIFSHVVSPRSAGLFEGSKVKSTYWKEISRGKDRWLEKIGKKEALSRASKWQKPMKISEALNRWKRPKNILKDIKYNIKNYGSSEKYGYGKPIFRDVKIPKNMRRLHKPYMALGTKLKLGFGLGLLAGSIGYMSRED